jgi:hypothetical protein
MAMSPITYVISSQDLKKLGLDAKGDIHITPSNAPGSGGRGSGSADAVLETLKWKTLKAEKERLKTFKAQHLQSIKHLETGERINEWMRIQETYNANAIHGIKKFGSSLLDSSTQVSDFGTLAVQVSSNLGFLSKTLAAGFNQLTIEVTKQIETFRNLSEVGAQFSGDLFTYRKLAMDAGVSLQMFQDGVSSVSGSLALFGGSTIAGVKRFSEISGILQKDFGPAMVRLGIQFEDQLDYWGDYLEIQTRLGRSQKMSTEELTTGAKNYVLQLDQLATLTGKQRKEIARTLKETMADKSIAGIFQALEAGANENLRGIIGALEGLQPDMAKGMKDLIATGGIPMTDMGRSLVLLNPNLQNMARRARDGEIGVHEFNAAVRETADLAMARSDAELRLTPILAQQGNTVLDAITMMRQHTKFGKELTQADKERGEIMESNHKASQGLGRSFQRLANALLYILQYPIKGLTWAIDAFAAGLEFITTGRGGLGALVGGIGAVIGAFLALRVASWALKGTFGLLSKISFMGGGGGGGKIASKGVGAMKALGTAGPAVAKGGVFAGLGIGALGLLGGAGIGAGLFLTGKGLGVVADGLQRVTSIDSTKLMNIVGAIGSLTATFGIFNTNTAQFAKNMSIVTTNLNSAVEKLDSNQFALYNEKLGNFTSNLSKVNNELSTTTATTGKVTGDKLDTLNSTMNEILSVLSESRGYVKIISKKDWDNNLFKNTG